MSLVNVWISPDRALVGVDTEGVTLDGTHNEVSKMIPLVHANLVLATRGHMGFLNALFGTSYAVGGDFDAIVEKMPMILSYAFNHLMSQASSAGVADQGNFDRQDAFIVGWSRKHCRMLGMSYSQETAKDGFTGREIDSWCVSPWEDPGVMPPIPNTPEVLKEVARTQASFASDPRSEAAVGGRLLVAEITRDGIIITSRCDLGSRNRMSQ